LFLCWLAAITCASDVAERAFREGQKAERSGDHLKAYLLYTQAAQADASNPLYSGRRAAVAQSNALRPLTQVVPNPANQTITAELEAEGLTDGQSLESPAASLPPRLAASPEKHSFRIKGGAREMFEQVAAAYGVHVLFDPGYQEPPRFTFAITDAGYRDALRALETGADSFLVPLDEATALVARDTPQNRTQLIPVVAMAVPIPERMTLQEAQELTTAVQQTLEIRRISLDAQKRVVYFRDTVSKVYAAREMFASLSRPKAQIVVDIELLSFSKTSSLRYGLALPPALSITSFGVIKGIATSTVGSPMVAVANSTAFATLSRASATTLLEAQIVSLDGQAATLRVGDHYPVTSATISSVSGGAVAGFAPVINYVDLGLGLKLTPEVHEGGEVSLDIEAEFKALEAGGANGLPAISNQQYQGKVRLREGEWAVVAGLVSVADIGNATGIPGLQNLPLIGHLFRYETRENDRNEVFLVLKPHLIAAPAWDDDDVAGPIWTGTETRPMTTF